MNERHIHPEKIMKTNARKPAANYLATACAALVLGLAAPLHAGEVTGPDVTVRYGDLAIDTEPGARKLLQRIESAAQRICAPLDHGDLASRANEMRCRAELTAAAVDKVKHPMLQAAFDAARGIRPPMASLGR
jgi:UrcA family protein